MDFEVWRRSATSVSGPGVPALRLGDGRPELLVEFIKVHSKLSCSKRGNVTFRVDRNVRMVAFVGKEGRNSSRGVRSIVIGKLRDWKKVGPVVLLVVAIDLEVLFKGLIRAFGLSVTFRVVPGGEVELHVESHA